MGKFKKSAKKGTEDMLSCPFSIAVLLSIIVAFVLKNLFLFIEQKLLYRFIYTNQFRTSERMIEQTFAGLHRSAKRPPLTLDSFFRMVLMETISRASFKKSLFSSCNSFKGISGLSNKALAPPESRKTTVSSFRKEEHIPMASSVALTEFSSTSGWPASKQRTCSICPPVWPYLVITMPSLIFKTSLAAFAMEKAALPTASR